MLIKICGITNWEDARRAVEWGADALGFNFHPPSPRFIEPSQANLILRRLGGSVLTVAVKVGAEIGDVGHCRAVQIHGLKHAGEVPISDRKLFIAVQPELVDQFPGMDIVIDGSWGTGKKADWKALASIRRPYILSGGLTPDNVAEAIRLLRPMGVDVCSGVESEPGKKDPIKLGRFIQAALEASRGLESWNAPH